MVKLNKIYTRTGDDGTTGLVDGSRIAKSDALMAAIGDVDEANSAVGIAAAALDPASDEAKMLSRIQNELFDLGADLATPPDIQFGFGPHEMALRIVPSQIARLEDEIDAMNGALDALKSFILPGGTEAAARLHLARAIARRAERAAVTAGSAQAAAHAGRPGAPSPARAPGPIFLAAAGARPQAWLAGTGLA
ncbi:MAG TPA: cob(I)yrinic acid a,c-diamide adenosyltransferase, partial [Sphingopyxis sp.]|nr:cob(I)yrinic acid a,c-diamide adenosyltransferase [Sphingopyxis sp.]